MATLPPKLYFRIGEVATLVGVEPHVLRYWEREFRSIRPTKSAKGQRVYSRRDVENLMRVRDLLYADGFTIAGAKKKLQHTGTEPAPAPLPDAGKATDPAHGFVNEPEPPSSPVAPSSTRAPEPEAHSERSVSAEVAGAEASDRSRPNAHARAALLELRGEIEALLTELGG